MTRPKPMSRMCLSSRLPRGSGGNRSGRGLLGVVIAEPILRREEVDAGQSGDDEQEDPGHGCRIAHVVALEALQVEVERVEERGVDRSARAAADDERLGEGLERLDHFQYEVEEDDRREQGQRDRAELTELAGPV